MFWMPMASIRSTASLMLPEPNPTPTARPSGMLCSVMAMMKSHTPRMRLL